MLQDFLMPGVLVYATGRKEEACMWQMWQGYHSRGFVVIFTYTTINLFWSFTKYLFKEKWKFGGKLFETKLLPRLSQKVCRVLSSSVLFFPCQDRDCEHAMLKITKSNFPWSKKSAFVIFSQLTNPRRYTSRNLFSAEHLARVRPCPWVAASQTVYFVRHDIFVSQGT